MPDLIFWSEEWVGLEYYEQKYELQDGKDS
jgi:hypothetical protein